MSKTTRTSIFSNRVGLVAAGLVALMVGGSVWFTTRTARRPSHASAPIASVPDTCPDFMVIPCQFQTAELSIPIIGTAFSLHYSSARVPGRKVAPSDLAATDIGQWSLSVLAHLDVKRGIWLGGNGSRRRVTPVKVDGMLAVASVGGRIVDIFDEQGRELERIDALTKKRLQTFTWKDNGLTEIVDAYGKTKLERGSDGNVTAIVSPLGVRTATLIDNDGDLVSISRQSGKVDRFAYGPGGLLKTWTDNSGAVRSYSYDSKGRLSSIHEPTGVNTTFRRSAAEPRTVEAIVTESTTPARWSVMRLKDGWRWSMTQPSGATATEDVLEDGRRAIRMSDGTVAQFSLEPDPEWGMAAPVIDRLQVISPGGRKIDASEARTVTAGTGLLTPRVEDRVVTVNGQVTREHFDPATDTIRIISAAGRTTTMMIDAADRVTKLEAPGVSPLSYDYDDHGRVTAVVQGTGPKAHRYAFSWDAATGEVSVTDPLGATIRSASDADGRPQVVSRGDGQRVVVDRSADGRPIAVTVNGKAVMTMGHDATGRLTSFAPVGGDDLSLTRFDYDGPRLSRIANPDGTSATFAYDRAGRLASANAGAGDYVPTYDPRSGVVDGWTEPGPERETIGYDGVLPMTDKWQGVVAGSVTLERDSLGRVASVTVGNSPKLAISRDPDGFVLHIGNLKITRDAASGMRSGTRIGAIGTATRYDAFARRSSIGATGVSGTLFDERLTRGADGRIVEDTLIVDGATTRQRYAYDSAGRLSSVSRNSDRLVMKYDERDNLVALSGSRAASFTIDSRGRLTSDGTRRFEWTSAGTLRSVTVNGQKTEFTFDAFGHIASATLPNGRRIGYVTDAEGRRIARLVDGALTQGYLYAPGSMRPVGLVDGKGHVEETFAYFGPGAPVLIKRGEHVYRVISDHLGSPRLVVDIKTGEVVEQLDYDVFGRITRDTRPGFQPFGYAGGLVDQNTGFVNFGARDYDPTIGRWTSRDRAVLRGGANGFEYAADNWPNVVDANGAEPENSETANLECEAAAGIECGTPWRIPMAWPPRSSCACYPPDEANASYNPAVDAESPAEIAEHYEQSSTSDAVEAESGRAEQAAEQASEVAYTMGGSLSDSAVLQLIRGGESLDPWMGATFGVYDLSVGFSGLLSDGGDPEVQYGQVLAGVGELAIAYGGATLNPYLVGGGFVFVAFGALYQAHMLVDGDPHFRSADGNLFDLQGAGEYVLADDPGGGFDVQLRLEPSGSSRIVSVATAVAIGLRGQRVGIYRGAKHELRVDGRAVDLPSGSVKLGSVGRVVRLLKGGYVVQTADGRSGILVSDGGRSLNVKVIVDRKRGARLRGLAGSIDGNAGDDFTLRDGSVLKHPDFTSIHRQFAESWRVKPAESLFDYAPGRSTNSYTDRTFPDHEATIRDVEPAAKQAAIAACRGAGLTDQRVLGACILDVGLLRDPSLAAGLVDMGVAGVSLGSSSFGKKDTFQVSVGMVVGPDSPANGAGRINKANNEQEYKLQVNAPSAIYLAAAKGCTSSNLYWTVRLPNGHSVGYENICTDIGPVRFDTAGTATISVSSQQGATGTYGFSILESEPVQRFAVTTGTPITIGSPGPGAAAIDKPGGEDRYELSGASGDAFYIAAAQNCVESGLHWYLVSPEGSTGAPGSTLCSDIGVLRFDKPGTWTIVVSATSVGSNAEKQATGKYGFRVLRSEPVQQFDVKLGATISPGVPSDGAGRIERAGGEDWYLFSGTKGISVQVTPGANCKENRVQAYLVPPGSKPARVPPNGATFVGPETPLDDPCSNNPVPAFLTRLDQDGKWAVVVVGSGTQTGDYSFTLKGAR